MKFTALLFVVAVCAVLLPSEAKSTRSVSDFRSLVQRAPVTVARRQPTKRDETDSEDSDSDDSDEANIYLEKFLSSGLVKDLLDANGITMEEIDEAVDTDDEIEPEDRPLIKALAIITMVGLMEDSSEEVSSSEEDR